MVWRTRVGMGWMALVLMVSSGCYGPFNLTRRLYQWNGQIGATKWEREFMFILLAWAPVYGLAVAGDAIVFNSMEFWTGNNPVDPPSDKRRGALPKTKRVVRGKEEAILTYVPKGDGAELLVQRFLEGHPAGSLRIERKDGRTIGTDAEGRVVLSAQTLADGHVAIHDGNGRLLSLYGSDQADRLMRVTTELSSSIPSSPSFPSGSVQTELTEDGPDGPTMVSTSN